MITISKIENYVDPTGIKCGDVYGMYDKGELVITDSDRFRFARTVDSVCAQQMNDLPELFDDRRISNSKSIKESKMTSKDFNEQINSREYIRGGHDAKLGRIPQDGCTDSYAKGYSDAVGEPSVALYVANMLKDVK